MPLYEYQCLKCSQFLEVMQKFSDAPLEECPQCRGPVKKMISRTNFSLKGQGWYSTDYAKKAPVKAEPEAKKADPEIKKP